MLSKEFIRKIREIEIRTKKIVNTVFAGEYKSTFKGTGIEFLDVREYFLGDDIRSIDWKVTARMGKPFVKKFVEERELTVILCVDASGSAHFGTRGQLKIEQAAKVAATLAFSAVKNNDKVGLVFFTDQVEKYIPPRKGRFHALRLIRDILYFKPGHRGMDPALALEFLMHILKHRAIIFFISDFIGDGFRPDAIRVPLGVAARRHDLVAISITDPLEHALPRIGLVDLEDGESGQILAVDTSDQSLVDGFRAYNKSRFDARDRLLRSLNIDAIDLGTAEDCSLKLRSFFEARARRYR